MPLSPRTFVGVATALCLVCPHIVLAQVSGVVSGQVGIPPRDTGPVPTGTSVVRGRIVDAATGAPVRRAVVQIFSPEIRQPRATTTDVEGRYELKDLPAGRFTITVTKAGYVNGSYGQLRPQEPGRPLQVGDKQTVEKVDVTLMRGTVITGRVLDEYGEPVSDVQVSALRNQMTPAGRRPMPAGRVAMTNDIGEFRLFGLAPGAYFLSATYRSMMPVLQQDTSGYAPTYYPGTPDLSAAQQLTVGLGGSVTDVTVMLVPARTATITGTVVDAQGQLVRQGSVQVMPRSGPMMMTLSAGPIRPDGTFTLSGVPPGEYTLRGMLSGAPGAPPQTAIAFVSVSGADLENVRLEPMKTISVTGRVVLDPVAARSFKPELFRFTTSPAEPTFFPALPEQPALVQPDLTFEFKTYPGARVVRPAIAVTGWMIKAVYLNGADVTDGVTFGDEDVRDLEIDVTNRIPEISGRVTDAKGEAAREFVAIVFPQDRNRWASLGIGRSGMMRADAEGRFKFQTLRPGDYFLVAVDRLPSSDWTDPDFLESLRDRATAITLNDGETKTIDLKLIQQR